MKRTHRCGEIRASDIGKDVTLQGWAHGSRDHGGLMFIDLRDRTGISQVVVEPDNKDAFELAKSVHREWVLEVTGKVRRRPDVNGVSTINAGMPTGEVEVVVSSLVLHNKSKAPPFMIEERKQHEAGDVGEETRLKYRYLDLRRPDAQEALFKRSKAYQATRSYLHEQQFVEIETPYFVKYTPGGARNFLVPSRMHPGTFYALAESPQIFKQLSMVAGFDRYFQIARCFRDEDTRADRQPEFTQIDIEMSFVEENDVMGLVEGLLARIWKDVLAVEIPTPFLRLSWADAMERYGVDKPDIRFGLELKTITDAVKSSAFNVFTDAIAKGGVVKALVIPAAMSTAMSRKELDDMAPVAEAAVPGSRVAWVKTGDAWSGPPSKAYADKASQDALLAACNAKSGDTIVFAANAFDKANAILGALRLHLAKRFELVSGLETRVVTGAFKDKKVKPFADDVKAGKVIRSVLIRAGLARVLGAPGELVPASAGVTSTWLQTDEKNFNGWKGEHGKALGAERTAQDALLREAGGVAGDTLVLLTGDATSTERVAQQVMAAARKAAGIPESPWQFLWVYKFPLFEKDAETGNLVAAHHPFTSPVVEEVPLLATNPAVVKARAYDVVLNGNELGGGSIRIHKADVQATMFKALGISDEEAKQKFGFLLEAFEYGAPPHGGIAIGMDRLSMLLAGAPNLREVLAFPKNQRAQDAMTGAPTAVSEKQLRDLSIKSTANPDK